MDLYLFSLLLGFAGLVVMAFSGVAGHGAHAPGHGHTGGHLPGAGHGHAGHLHAGGHAAGHAGAAHGHELTHGPAQGHAHHGPHAQDGGRAAGGWFLSFLSPRVLFSILVGLGASGLLLHGLVPEPVLAALAVAGGLAFELLAVRPVWNFFFRFASEPALTLESAVTDTATAVTGFNADGEGLIRIELDGQIVQLLARLRPVDMETGIHVHAGDSLIVEEVDPLRNRCVVSLPAWPAGIIRGA